MLPERRARAPSPPNFPRLLFSTLVDYSRDGEFYGYAKAGAEGVC